MFQLSLSFLSSSAGLPSTPSASCLSLSLSLETGPRHFSLFNTFTSSSEVICHYVCVLCFWFYYCSGVFYYFNSALNPILYSVMSKRFRRGFSDITKKLLKRVFYLPTSHQSDDMGSRKQDSPKGRPRWVFFFLNFYWHNKTMIKKAEIKC